MVQFYLLLFLLLPVLFYFFFMTAISLGLHRRYPLRIDGIETFVSVLIAARNEEKHIEKCLESVLSQDYPKDHIEIIVIDDASADGTAGIVDKYAAAHPQIRRISQTEPERGAAPKKNALAKGVAAAGGEIIFTTDADARVSPGWVRTTLRYFTPETGVVFGWVGHAQEDEKGLFGKIQSLDYIGLIGLAAGFCGIGQPTMCNANNFAYRKKAFEEVNGYAGIDNVPSGDDEMLMQKIHDQTEWKVAFCNDSLSMTDTSSCSGLFSFFNQRSRWASKGFVYPRVSLRFLLPLLYIFYLVIPLLLFLSIRFTGLWKAAVAVFIIKTATDLPLLLWSLRNSGKTRLWPYIPLTEIFQILYIPLTAALGTFGRYRWKIK